MITAREKKSVNGNLFFKGTGNIIWITSGRNYLGAVKTNLNNIYITSFIFPSLFFIFSLNYSSLAFPLQTLQGFDFPLTIFFKLPNSKKPAEYFHQNPLILLMEKLYLKYFSSLKVKKMTCRTCQLSIAKQE